MLARSALAPHLRRPTIHAAVCRAASTATKPKPKPRAELSETTQPTSTPTLAPPPQSWLTRQVKSSPAAKKVFLGLATVLGYNSAKQIAGRRAYALYEQLCAVKADEDKEFWQEECRLPPTFQSWFTVTNLHVWLLTVRLRALPDPVGKYHIQSLIDHFFMDVEDRVRAVLQPSTRENTNARRGIADISALTDFYTIPSSDKVPKGNAPERLVTRQMKILKEQWQGMGVAFDIGLVRGDAELASAIWRNFLGARGARGIVYPSSTDKPAFRRSINLVGGEIDKVALIDKKGLEVEEARDDGSGLHDFSPNEAGLYVQYPELMYAIAHYIRKELVRLEGIDDAQVMGRGGESVQLLKFGNVRS